MLPLGPLSLHDSISLSPFGLLVSHRAKYLEHFSIIIYTAGIGALLTSFGLCHQLYADEVQAYMYSYCSSDCAVAAVQEMCLAMDYPVSDLSKKKQGGRRSTDVIKFY